MPNLAEELAHLEEAERHIAIARDNISRTENSPAPADAVHEGEAAKRLETMKSTLAAFEAHRALIVKTIEGIRDGSLPSGDESSVT
jgi:hypothetical protein